MRLAAVFALLSACAPRSDVAAPADTAIPAVTWTTFVQGFFLSYCQSCHASTAVERFGAPEGVTFDTPAMVLAAAPRIRAVIAVEGGRMPPGGGLDPAAVALVIQWLDAGGDPW